MHSISRVIIFFLAVYLFSFINVSLASNVSDIKAGKYVYSQQGEELIDGKRASITWFFDIRSDDKATVNISSWHAPFTCNGKYKIIKGNDELSLIWLEEDNKDTECDVPSPQFLIKIKSNNLLLIRSELFPWGNGGWERLKKVN